MTHQAAPCFIWTGVCCWWDVTRVTQPAVTNSSELLTTTGLHTKQKMKQLSTYQYSSPGTVQHMPLQSQWPLYCPGKTYLGWCIQRVSPHGCETRPMLSTGKYTLCVNV